MNKLIMFIGTCLFSCALFSCGENSVLEEVDNSGDAPQTKSSVDVPCYVQGDGSLCFRSTKDYFAVTDSLIKLTDQELNNWEKTMGFVSYRSYVNKFVNEVEEAYNDEDFDKFDQLLNKYAEYIYLDTDSLVKPFIKSKTYQCITNKDGVFYLGDVKNVVDETSVYSIGKERSMSPRISYVMTGNAREVTDVIGYKEYSYKKADYTKMVITSCSLLRNVVLTDTQGTNEACIQFHIFVDGKRKKGSWKHYSTSYAVEQIECVFKNIPLTVNEDQTLKSIGDFELSHPGLDEADVSDNHTFVYNLGLSVRNYTKPVQHAACIHYKAITGGTNPEGLGYNYANGKYGMDEDHNAGNCAKKVCDEHDNVHSGE